MSILVPQHVGARSSRGVVVAARIGYAAEAVVYAMLGTLAVMAALGIAGGHLTDKRGVMQTLGEQPFGTALLWATAVGMLCYALWNGVRAALDPEHKGSGGGAIAARVGYAFSAGAHVVLAVYAAQLAYGSRPSSGGAKTFVGKILHYPFGAWLVAAFGLIAVGFGIAQVVKAAKGKVGEQYQNADLSPRLCRAVQRVARAGVLARGVVFALIGASLVTAAIRRDPSRAEGYAEALAHLARSPFGVGLLLLVASGLLAYGIHLFFVARWGALPAPQ